jgi:pimeloyl-ACP methyl ester carboxylesterase
MKFSVSSVFRPWLCCTCLGFLTPGIEFSIRCAEPLSGYRQRVQVTAPTRLDWTFAVSNRSLVRPPAEWLPDYDSKQQFYELFVPAGYTPKKPYPLILFISPSSEPMGWKSWERVCKQLGILFAGPHGAGNDCPGKKRVRIVLDVLDDVRRHYHTDPDRTYVAGLSGGGRIACAIAFALPEYFGGMIPVCAGGELRTEPWLRQRMIDQLSVAMLTGETDFNRGEVERYRGPMLHDVGVRTKVWVFPKLGHTMPNGSQLQEVYQWLEGGARSRKEQLKNHAGLRVAGEPPASRVEWSQALLKEGKGRLKAQKTLCTGLMQLQGCMNRWPDLPAGKEAKELLLDYEAKEERTWEADDLAEQRRFLIAEARALDAYGSGPLPPEYAKQRTGMLKQAIQMWELIRKDGPDTTAGRRPPGAFQSYKKRLKNLEPRGSPPPDRLPLMLQPTQP